ncbi:hypothetical protein ZIOFF_057590 [Zingiber officinale]|uniref:Uncharacterized protein n=1 Tax=Zingiber officinale TaxID=94328 RepID=A0A8J5FCQ6_ZINOF|nr:hypothetical protein ZIOFF_057590 [Zingiber officinale]
MSKLWWLGPIYTKWSGIDVLIQRQIRLIEGPNHYDHDRCDPSICHFSLPFQASRPIRPLEIRPSISVSIMPLHYYKERRPMDLITATTKASDDHTNSSSSMADASVLHLLERISNRPVLRMRRGPMYSAYVELRDQKLWRNRARPVDPRHAINITPSKSSAMASPLRSSMPVFSIASRKENKKPKGAPATPPPATSKAMTDRVGSFSAYKAEEKKRVVAGAGRSGVASLRRSYTCLKQF